jgi:hypothetical protein
MELALFFFGFVLVAAALVYIGNVIDRAFSHRQPPNTDTDDIVIPPEMGAYLDNIFNPNHHNRDPKGPHNPK